MREPDHYPLPATHLIRHRYYRRAKRASAVVVASRGCPMKCSYCAVGAASAFRHRRRSVESVLREIERAVNTYNAGFIDFEDENLSLNRQWFLQLLHEIRKRFGPKQLELRAMNGLFPPSLDEEIIRAMKAAGFKTLNLSLGSTSEIQLERFQRPDVRDDFDQALNLAEEYDLTAVGYVIAGGPGQSAVDSISDLLFLAQRRVLVGVSIFYPAPGSIDYELCDRKKILPNDFACMRSSALPLSHTTSRKEAITLLRLARILNFMKSILDNGQNIPDPSSEEIKIDIPRDRIKTGKQLLAQFFSDGKIRGVTSEATVYEHLICRDLTHRFLRGLKSTTVRGSR